MKRKSEHSHKPLARATSWIAGRAAHGEQTAVVMAKIWRPAPGPLEAWKVTAISRCELLSSAPDERGNLICIHAHP